MEDDRNVKKIYEAELKDMKYNCWAEQTKELLLSLGFKKEWYEQTTRRTEKQWEKILKLKITNELTEQ